MEEDLEMPVITFLDQKEEESLDSSGEEGIIYLTTNEVITHDESKVPNYIIEQNVILDPITLDNTKFQLVTLGDQFIYITTEDNGEECIEPHLLTNEIVSPDTEDDNECQINEQTELIADQNEDIITVKPYEMIMVKNVKEESVVAPQRKYKCLYNGCDKVYLTSQHLTVHMRNHTDSKPYMCKYQGCGKSFSTNYSLTAHWRTHTGEKPYMCKVCTRSFKTSGDLMKHMRTHTGEKPFLCPIEGCGKSFTTSNIRKVHVRSHTGERPYICDYPNCGKAFASSTNHKNHSRIHSGEKPYVCNVEGCDKKFTEYSSLYKHQTVHQTTKPFECNYCQQKFKSESTLNVHRKVKHGVLVSSDGIQLLDLESVGLVQSS